MDIRTQDGATIVTIVPRFDAYTANEVETALRDLVAKGNKGIVCDFSQTEYVASAGLRVLLSLAKNLHSSGGQIILMRMKPYVHEVFEISGFTKIFKVLSSEKEALQTLNEVRVTR